MSFGVVFVSIGLDCLRPTALVGTRLTRLDSFGRWAKELIIP
jgi:hypothetical protein